MSRCCSSWRRRAGISPSTRSAVLAVGGGARRATWRWRRMRCRALAAAGGARHAERIVLDPVDRDLSLDLIDDAFNANPTSMAAALEVLAALQPVDGVGRIVQGRRIAVLGDMLELGGDESRAARGPGRPCGHARAVDLVHCVGPRMRAPARAPCRAERQGALDRDGGRDGRPSGAHADRRRRRRAGQRVEGQQGQSLLLTRSANWAIRCQPRPRRLPEMLYWLTELSDGGDIFNLFRYITFRAGRRVLHGADLRVHLRPAADQPAAATPENRPADPRRRPRRPSA